MLLLRFETEEFGFEWRMFLLKTRDLAIVSNHFNLQPQAIILRTPRTKSCVTQSWWLTLPMLATSSQVMSHYTTKKKKKNTKKRYKKAFFNLWLNSARSGQGQWQGRDTQRNITTPSSGNARTGWRLYDGPGVTKSKSERNLFFSHFFSLCTQQCINCHFFNYDVFPNEGGMQAIAPRSSNTFQMATTTQISGSQFFNSRLVLLVNGENNIDNGNRQFRVTDNAADGGKTSNIFDTDGSISGYLSATVLPTLGFYSAPGCVSDPAFGYACPHRYSNLWILDMDKQTPNPPLNNPVQLLRNQHEGTSHTSYAMSLVGFWSAEKWRYQAIVSPGASYLVSFSQSVSSNLVFQLNNAEKDDFVTFVVSYPSTTTITRVFRGFGLREKEQKKKKIEQ
jgi:hypothetical protein